MSKDFVKGFFFTISLVIILFLIIAAKSFGTPAYTSSISCSQDGKYVYLSDGSDVYKSDDYAETWKMVTPDKKSNVK